MSAIDVLITNRTQADADLSFSINSKQFDALTTEEQQKYFTDLLGSYNASDLNRVGAAIIYLMNLLNGIQSEIDAFREEKQVASDIMFNVTWDEFSLTVKTDFEEEEIQSPDEMAHYLYNVDTITNAITIEKSLPLTMRNLSYSGANAIEKALIDENDAAISFEERVMRYIENTSKSFVYSGQPYSGMIWSQFS